MIIKLSSRSEVQKLDLKRELKPYLSPSAKKVEVVRVPRFQFAMIDGEIEPGLGPGTSPGFAEALEALYGISYTLKFMIKLREQDPVDYPVGALEGLWWVEDYSTFEITRPEGWHYTVMILQPDVVTPDLYAEGLRQLRKKRGDKAAFSRMRLQHFEEGLCVQILHVGPYAGEMETVAKMDAYAHENGFHMVGKHHEIYLGDPRRAQAEKLRTILRHPVAEV